MRGSQKTATNFTKLPDLQKLVVSTGFSFYLFGCGQRPREELERETSRTLALGAVYRTLGRLEVKGYLRTRIGPPTRERGGRRKKFYVLNPTGLEAARRSLADLQKLMKGLQAGLEIP